MFSGCGSLYKAFRQAPGLLVQHIVQYNIYIYILFYYILYYTIILYYVICYGFARSLGRRGRPTLGSYLITVWWINTTNICFCFLQAPSPPRQWFDKDYRAGAQNDLTTLQGFVVAVKDCLRIKSGGLLHGGHPCNGCLGLF